MPTQSFSRAAERREKRRQQILDTASRLFSNQGYHNVTLRAIAEELGYAHAALYRYFPDKASLLAEICRETFGRLTQELDAQQNQAQGPEARLLALSLGFVRFGLAHPHHFRVVFSGSENLNGIGANEHLSAIGRPLFARLMQAFIECSTAVGFGKRTRMLDANTWWISLFGTSHILISSCPVIGPSSHEDIIQRHIQVMWQGFKLISGRPSPVRRKTSAKPKARVAR